jgi:O-antigen biosynthesis protein
LQPIIWIGRRHHADVAARAHLQPIRISRGALGEDLPHRDLWVSPEHAMYVEGMLIPAAALVNGISIVRDDSFDQLTYFHLEFARHQVIFAEGAAAESFVDDDSREMFDNAHTFTELYPHAISKPAHFCAPRVEDGAELEKVRSALLRRAMYRRRTHAPAASVALV